MKLYGIANCSTVKSARAWLAQHAIEHEFVDFKKLPPTRERLVKWCEALGWERVLNRRGNTWRTLDAQAQECVTDAKSAIAVMLEKPSIIKRPVVEKGATLLIGFDPERYAEELR